MPVFPYSVTRGGPVAASRVLYCQFTINALVSVVYNSGSTVTCQAQFKTIGYVNYVNYADYADHANYVTLPRG